MPKQCRHIKTSGAQCRAYRVWKEDYCFFHLNNRTPHGAPRRTHNPEAPKNGVEIPLLDDAASVQLAVTRVLTALSAGKVTPAEVNAYIYALRLAAHATRAGDILPEKTVECFVNPGDGDLIGPELFKEERRDDHPLTESGMLAMRDLVTRLAFESKIDAYLLAGKEPPGDMEPPSSRIPTEEAELMKWAEIGWKYAQARAHAIHLERNPVTVAETSPAK